MEEKSACAAFAALGHDLRLRIFRHLLRQGDAGLAAGELGAILGIAASSLSFHLTGLEQAGLLRSWRVGRSIRYAVDLSRLAGLIGFLVGECCADRADLQGQMFNLGLYEQPKKGPGGVAIMQDKIFSVLFLCTGNSARSIMAECILSRLGQGRFRAYSAGSHPKGQVNPYAIDALKLQNYPTNDLRSKSWDEFAQGGAPQLDFVFTVCDAAAAEMCPVWPGQPMTAHWGLPDPAAVAGNEAEKRLAFAEAMKFLTNRIGIFVSLPMRSLDRLSLQKRLDEIGRSLPQTA